MLSDLEKLKDQLSDQTKDYKTEIFLHYLVEKFGNKIAFATSFGAEDQVIQAIGVLPL